MSLDPEFHQEEADTNMFLRGKQAMENGVKSIVIRSSDTDVKVLACFFLQTSMYTSFLLSLERLENPELLI